MWVMMSPIGGQAIMTVALTFPPLKNLGKLVLPLRGGGKAGQDRGAFPVRNLGYSLDYPARLIYKELLAILKRGPGAKLNFRPGLPID
jgi:hypothetical protein